MAVLGAGGLWPERCPKVGEGGGSGGLRAPFVGIVPLCHSAAPWAQGLPSTSPYVPWAPAPSSPRAWGALDMGWWPQCSTRLPASGAAPRARQRLRGGKASRDPAGGKGRRSHPARDLPALPKRTGDCQGLRGPFFPGPLPLERGEVPSLVH